jgi:hypothetical protein
MHDLPENVDLKINPIPANLWEVTLEFEGMCFHADLPPVLIQQWILHTVEQIQSHNGTA